jgi:hypothetical protein
MYIHGADLATYSASGDEFYIQQVPGSLDYLWEKDGTFSKDIQPNRWNHTRSRNVEMAI